MRIKQAEERSEINLPVSEVVKEGGKFNILPDVKKYFSIDYKPRKDSLTLVAGGFIGLIPINTDLAIEIKPKFSISNLTRIVSIAEDNFNTLSFFSRKYAEQANYSPVIFDFLAECLVNELKTLEVEGIFKNYQRMSDNTSNVKGRINLNSSIKNFWSHGHFNKASIDFFEFTPNNPFNRLIKFTLHYCLNELSSVDPQDTFLKRNLIHAYSLFDNIPLVEPESDLELALEAIKNGKVPVLREYYVNICEICRLIINRIGVNFDELKGDLTLNSFTLDMSVIFEKYLLNSIRNNRNLLNEDVSILDGNNEGRKKFFNPPSHGKGDAKPDIILKTGDKYSLIADAKYKLSTKEADRYQVISHALSYNAKLAVLILPKKTSYNGDSLVKLGAVGSEYQVTLYEYYFDLASASLEQMEKELTATLQYLIDSSSA
ncbi:hypothetical protein GCM10011332_27670 [Terasakiella brassicae]|uniref:Restriction endonuclease n=1 Tax=Terasakiella brassicae TaxID=1634917 RepID=A0A917C4P3_9PROT|nr:restriction endonuclease [Terasakiella brassicae]GGF72160.1 hypothetical protein GCM10011332_27670 [Terasakiella brassicae]